MRYALYARKSTEEDERQTQSIDDQKRRGLEFAHHKGWTDMLVVEEAYSAKEQGRPEFDRLLKMVDKGEIDGILAWHPDRLSRNEMDAAAITMRVRKGGLKELHFVNYFFHNSPEGIMMLQIALSQSQYFSSKLVVDVKRGLDSKIRKGWYPHYAPPGYQNDKHLDKGERTISPDPARFPLIRRVFDHVLTQGYTPKELLHLLNDAWGYTSRPSRKRGDRPMSKTTLYNLLGNRFYTGYFVHAGQLHQGSHQAMITLDEYSRVQAILGRNERLQPKKYSFAYTGAIHCAHCARQITAHFSTNRYGSQYAYYRCLGCRGQNIAERALQAQIDAEVERIYIPEKEFVVWAKEAVARWVVEERETDHALYAQKLRTLGSLDSQIDGLLTALTKGLIEDEEYKARKRQLQEQRVLLREETKAAELRADQARAAMENVLTFIENVKIWMALGDTHVKRACLRGLGVNFQLDHKKLVLEPHPLLARIRDEYKPLEAKYREIQHDETLSESQKTQRLDAVRSTWCGIWGYNQTRAHLEGLAFPDLRRMGSVSLLG